MDPAAISLSEVQILGALCNQTGAREQRAELAQTLDRYTFVEPEHLIVFGSIRFLLVHDQFSKARLAVHLNNRGFSDVDLEKYCAAGFASIDEALELACRMCSLAPRSGEDVRHDGQEIIEHEI